MTNSKTMHFFLKKKNTQVNVSVLFNYSILIFDVTNFLYFFLKLKRDVGASKIYQSITLLKITIDENKDFVKWPNSNITNGVKFKGQFRYNSQNLNSYTYFAVVFYLSN